MESEIGKDRMARATFAAILAAQKEGCNCKACEILRGAGDVLIEEFGIQSTGRIRKITPGKPKPI